MLTQLRKKLKSENKDKNIIDIVLYGSSTRTSQKYNDIDIMVLFKEGTLKERLEKIQTIKHKLNIDNIDIKQMLLLDLFDASNLARTGIILEGISLIDNRKLSEKIGFKSFSIFYYTLEGLTHTQKIKFNYILSGRTTEGLISQMKGKKVVNGCVKIPIENTELFKEILNNNNIKYTYENILTDKF